ncbi:MAG: D-tagatose 3-epimerase [Verrucomicrobiales bacterium]|nr:D-tagatose 3-epimerase [Verrucomicrobiales bacterium]
MPAMRFGICNEIFDGWSIDDTFEFCAKTGYDAVEIAPFTIAPYVTDISADERKRIRAAADKHSIAISGLHWVLVKAEGMHLTDPDDKTREKTAQYLVDLVDCAADLGGNTIVVGSPKQRDLQEGVSFEQGWQWATDCFRRSVMRGEERGVTVCFEPLAPSETNFINTAEQAIEFVDQLHSPSFKIILDCKAMSSESKPIPQVIKESWPNFAYFHANDENLKGPGFGNTDFKAIGAALREVGYKGVVSVEVFNFEEGPEVIATRSLEHLRENVA